MALTPYYETKLGKLYHGDCLEVLSGVHSIDAIITDPPFAFTGGISNGSSANVSGQFFSFWWKAIAIKISEILKPTASGFIWCDWKTAKIISDGFEPTTQTYNFFRISQMLYHFRKMPGMGKPFRSSVDMVAYLRGPKHKNTDRIPENPACLNMISDYWYYGKHEFHPAEKSPAMYERFIKWSTDEGDTIIDIFFGSGAGGLSAERLNRKWIGCEISEKYCEIASKRIEKEAKQLKLFK